jgi:hypothetical protein
VPHEGNQLGSEDCQRAERTFEAVKVGLTQEGPTEQHGLASGKVLSPLLSIIKGALRGQGWPMEQKPIAIVWEQMKARARQCAAEGGLPTSDDAKVLVSQLFREARVNPTPPQEVVDMYAREFIAMIDSARDADHPDNNEG